jgi:hypothetical protein
VLRSAAAGGARRPPRSLHAEYQHFIDQRIEEYKDQLPRADILAIGDEAVGELARSEQIQLTEVVLREHVDAIIRRRLRLPSFRRWRERHLALRAAQVEPGHWGLHAHDPVVALAELVEDGDAILIVGVSDGACALFLAARGATVHVVDPDLAAVYGLENRAITESLGGRIDCEVVPLTSFTGDGRPFVACVIETGSVAALPAAGRRDVIQRLKVATPAHGCHVIMPAPSPTASELHVSADALRTLYADWDVQFAPGGSGTKRRNAGFIARPSQPS